MKIDQRCNNAQIIDKLKKVTPGREYIFVWKHDDKEKIQLTTNRQRPLWRFFPTRPGSGGGTDWVIWRWRDFYYDTNSVAADRLLGWHVNAEDLPHQTDLLPAGVLPRQRRHPRAQGAGARLPTA